MDNFWFDLVWTVFWFTLAVLGLMFHWSVILIFIFFLLAGFFYIDGDIW